MVGIFYEMYDVRNPETGESNTSFLELVDMLGLKVSVKKGEGPGGLDGLVAGIPDYTVHKWAGRLTQLGWTVVLIEQVKNAAGKVVKRAVERILTPGSHVEAATNADMFITFVQLSSVSTSTGAPHITATALDLTTGHLHVFDMQANGTEDAWTCNDMVQFMELYSPREVLWSIEGSKGFCESVTDSKLRSVLGCQLSTTFHKRAPLNSGAWTKSQFKEDYLRRRCGLKSLLPTHVALHVAQGSRAEMALVSLLFALEELWPSMTLGTLLVFPWIPGSMMCLGENALVQLHMILQNDQSSRQDVLSIFDKCATPMGRRGLRERLLKPSADIQVIQANLDSVEVWTKVPMEYRMDVVKRLRTVSDLQRLYRKLQQGSLNSTDLMGLDMSLKSAMWFLDKPSDPVGGPDSDNETSKSDNLGKDILEIRAEVFKIFDIQKIYDASEDTSMFKDGVVPELDSLESKIKECHTRLNKWMADRAASISVSVDVLKPEFKEKSLVIKGPRGAIQTLKASGKLPADCSAITNKTSSYLESPELDQIFTVLSKYRESLKKQQGSSLVEHGYALATNLLVPWTNMSDWISHMDVNLTLARVALDMGYTKPTLVDSGESHVHIEGLRHPLLEAQDRKIPYVQHSIDLGGKHQGWLLYGLNASGKSSLMRATGLAVLLAQGGSFVPASKMTLAPFTSLHTRIMNTDNLWMGLSSFAVEMSEMRDIFLFSGPKSLVLGDELCSGTETMSATALVAAGLGGLLKRGAKFLFATHLHGLSQIDDVSSHPKLKIKHLHVEYDKILDKLIYHRTLRDGPGSSLYGLEVAKAMRIPDDILENAIRYRRTLAGEAELSTSVGSSWNSAVIRRTCEQCGAAESAALEVHHIKERSTANQQGILPDGSNVHSTANLVVLCDTCHDNLHSGKSEIGPLVLTSHGPERSIMDNRSESRSPKSKWSEEEQTTIREVCSRFTKLSMPNLSKYLLNEHGIQIGTVALKKFRDL